MTALVAAVFIASLLGSTHCAGMCGAFLAFAVAGDDPKSARRSVLHAAYNGGRLATYAALGAAAGAIGAAVDLGGSLAGVQRAAAIAAGALLIGFGLAAILRWFGVSLPRPPVPARLGRMVASGHRAVFAKPPVIRAAAVGLLTTLLPCGWLYAFAITAAGTASPVAGAVVMAVFWAGTLPIMIGLGVGVQSLAGCFRRYVPLATSLLLVGVGIATVAGRLTLPPLAPAHAATPVSHTAAADRVKSLDATEMPCCADDR